MIKLPSPSNAYHVVDSVALVTGATDGIGSAVSGRLAAAHAQVGLHGSDEGRTAVAEPIGGGGAATFPVNVEAVVHLCRGVRSLMIAAGGGRSSISRGNGVEITGAQAVA